ncbi:unnamed protein product [Polarella glacialis]|uniref:Pseudouridine synthase RsuA/RluA-like domain-containing protein n=1 Tax=Polarella glacialis TaxID=89957 RepID=A0A813LI48_POLGL|nr:unnamed protein product [Polarella glacialis]
MAVLGCCSALQHCAHPRARHLGWQLLSLRGPGRACAVARGYCFSTGTSSTVVAAAAATTAAAVRASRLGFRQRSRRFRSQPCRLHVAHCAQSSPLELWSQLEPKECKVTVTEALLEEARRSAHQEHGQPPLSRLVAAAFPELLPTKSAARAAVKRGDVSVGDLSGSQQVFVATSASSPAPGPGTVLTATVGQASGTRPMAADLEARLDAWNTGRSEAAQVRVLMHDVGGWAIVNKPAGMHTSPIGSEAWHTLTLQSYLPALLPPPQVGIPCRGGPKACHRLDFRVSGPVAVATSEEAGRWLNAAFQNRLVHKKYRAIVCGWIGEPGQHLSVDTPVGGLSARTEVEVLSVVPCPYFGNLSELCLRPVEGRYHQLRLHCSEVLGAPIVNEESSIFDLAADAWQRRHGTPLPSPVRRSKGNLFLQAFELSLPPPPTALRQSGLVTVRTTLSERFGELLMKSRHAFEAGWRHDSEGNSVQLEAPLDLSDKGTPAKAILSKQNVAIAAHIQGESYFAADKSTVAAATFAVHSSEK